MLPLWKKMSNITLSDWCRGQFEVTLKSSIIARPYQEDDEANKASWDQEVGTNRGFQRSHSCPATPLERHLLSQKRCRLGLQRELIWRWSLTIEKRVIHVCLSGYKSATRLVCCKGSIVLGRKLPLRTLWISSKIAGCNSGPSSPARDSSNRATRISYDTKKLRQQF